MKIFLFIINLLITNFYLSQNSNYKFFAQYQLNYKSDSTQNYYKKTGFVLLSGNEGSLFKPTGEYVKDSLISLGNQNIEELNKKFHSTFKYTIKYNKKENDIIFQDKFFRTNVFYKEKSDFKWNIINETKLIKNIKCQKATTYVYGRKWIAWFSEEYPFSYGPYKFHGLPGLIFEIFDEKETYIFSLLNFKKIDKAYPDFYNDKGKEVTKNQYLEIKKKSKGFDFIFGNATFENPSQAIELRKKMEEAEKKNNNPLELKN
jgi:GLPGLI family protein